MSTFGCAAIRKLLSCLIRGCPLRWPRSRSKGAGLIPPQLLDILLRLTPCSWEYLVAMDGTEQFEQNEDVAHGLSEDKQQEEIQTSTGECLPVGRHWISML